MKDGKGEKGWRVWPISETGGIAMEVLVAEPAEVEVEPELDPSASFVSIVDAMVCKILRRHAGLPAGVREAAEMAAVNGES